MTLSDAQRARYLRARAKGIGSLHAYRMAVYEPAARHIWQESSGIWSAEWSESGFDIVATLTTDDYGDLRDSGYGEFTDDDGPDTIPNVNAGYREWKHFRPDYAIADRITDLRRTHTRAEARRLALEYAEDDMRLAAEYQPFVLNVSASVDGHELGSAGVGGVEFDTDEFWRDSERDRDLDMILEESCLADEAIDDARATLARLQTAAAALEYYSRRGRARS